MPTEKPTADTSQSTTYTSHSTTYTSQSTTYTSQSTTVTSQWRTTVTTHRSSRHTKHRPTGSTTHRSSRHTKHRPTGHTTDRPSNHTRTHKPTHSSSRGPATSKGTREPTTPDICSPSASAGFGTDVTPNHAPGTADCAPPGQGLTVPVAVLTAAGVLLVVVLVVVALVCRRRHRRSQRAGRTVCGPGAGCNRTFIKSCFNQSTNDDGFNDPLIAHGATDGGQRRYGSQDLASGSDLAQPGSGTGVQRSEVVARGRSSAQATSPSDKPGEATDAQQGRDTLSPTTEAATTVDQSSPAADERPPRSNTPHTVSRSLDTASGHYEVVTLGDADSGTASPLDPTPISSEANASTAGRGPLLPPDHDDSSSSSLSQQLGEADETKKSGGRWHRHGDGHDSAASLTAADGYSDLNRCSDPSRGLRRSHAYENYSHV